MALTAHAGLIVEQDITTAQGTRRTTIRIQGSKVRFDNGNGCSSIMDTKSKKVVTIFYHDAIASKSEGDDAMREAAKYVQTEFIVPRGLPEKYEEKVGGRLCTVSDWKWGTTRSAIWTAQKHPAAEKFAECQKVLAAFHCECLPGLSSQGVVMKTTHGLGENALTVTLVSARVEVVPAEVFEIPEQLRVITRRPHH